MLTIPTLLAIQFQLALATGGHAHTGADLFEWAGIFETPESVYLWTAQKTEGDGTVEYVDATMMMAILPAAAATSTELHRLEGEGNHALNMTCEDVQNAGILTPREDHCYNLQFKQNWWQSLYKIDTAGHAQVAFFAQHVPTEFENTAHYLKDDHGDDIEPIDEICTVCDSGTTPTSSSEEEEEKHWGDAMVVSILVNLVTLVGVILVIPALAKLTLDYQDAFECLISGFAAGAISSCAFFLLLFEATHLIATEYEEEVDVIWRWGIMILIGYFFPACLQIIGVQILPLATGGREIVQVFDPKTAQTEIDDSNDEASKENRLSTKIRMISGILIGDFMHNLCDGFFIGAAFKGCGKSFGWQVAWSTIAHELAQEISDFALLVGPDVQMHAVVALALNFLSGTSVILGAIIVLASEVEDVDIGLLLAFGGGTYLHIAFSECMPRVYAAKVSIEVRALALLGFIFGSIAIGLVLVDHEHCVPPLPPGAAPAPSGGHH